MSISTGYALALEAEYHRKTRDPFGGGHGPAFSASNPSGFRAYMTMSRYYPQHEVHRVTDLYGKERWLNRNGYRIMLLALEYAHADIDCTTGEFAEKIGVCRQTVSRWLVKLTAWGLIGSDIVRGKYGGIVFFLHRQGDNLEHYANVARAKIRSIYARKLNVHPSSQGGQEAPYQLPSYLRDKGAHLNLIDILALDRSRSQGMIQCPAHEDRQKSLSWKVTHAGKLLLHCFAGCTFDEIRKAAV